VLATAEAVPPSGGNRVNVVIAGGGVAALEAALARCASSPEGSSSCRDRVRSRHARRRSGYRASASRKARVAVARKSEAEADA
jgi:hypothetical protein